MPGQWQPRSFISRLIGNKMTAKKLQLRIPGCEITSVVNTANSCFRVCRTEANLDHVITGRQNNRLLSPPVLWAQWVTSYPKYSKGATSTKYEFLHVDGSSPDGFRVGLSNVLTQPCGQMTRYGEASTKLRRRVAFLTCLISSWDKTLVICLWVAVWEYCDERHYMGRESVGLFSMAWHGELADCVGCTNIFTCLLRISSGSKYPRQWSELFKKLYW